MPTGHQPSLSFSADAVIIGGCGRVGLPLGIALASRGLSVRLYDLNAAAVAMVNDGRMPFTEQGADQPLRAAIRDGRLKATTDPAVVSTAEVLVIVVGTPVDEHLNPDLGAVPKALERCAEYPTPTTTDDDDMHLNHATRIVGRSQLTRSPGRGRAREEGAGPCWRPGALPGPTPMIY